MAPGKPISERPTHAATGQPPPLVDVNLDWPASTLMVIRVAPIAVALAKVWINKRLPNSPTAIATFFRGKRFDPSDLFFDKPNRRDMGNHPRHCATQVIENRNQQ